MAALSESAESRQTTLMVLVMETSSTFGPKYIGDEGPGPKVPGLYAAVCEGGQLFQRLSGSRQCEEVIMAVT